ncbi:Rv3235 family protein [Cellulomonas sp. NPDC055163]
MTTLELDRAGGPVPCGTAAPHTTAPRTAEPRTAEPRTADATRARSARPAGAPNPSHAADLRTARTGRAASPEPAGGAGPRRLGESCTAQPAPPDGLAPASVAPGVRLVPTLPPAPRPAPSTGPGHTRPPTLEQRLLARRRATLAAERAARTPGPPRETPAMSDPTPVCCALALAATEAMRGTRSVAQLARWVSPQVFEQLAARAALTVRVLGRTAATRRPEILRVRVCRLGEHVAEAAVVVDDGTRVRAVALRLEMWRGAWRAVAFELG